MAINIAGANAYFAETVKNSVWSSFSTTKRTAAITQAKAMFSRALRRAMSETEAAYAAGDYIREDRACYEQAYSMLIESPIADATGSDPQAGLTGMAEIDTGPLADRVSGFSVEALAWLNWSGAAVIRG